MSRFRRLVFDGFVLAGILIGFAAIVLPGCNTLWAASERVPVPRAPASSLSVDVDPGCPADDDLCNDARAQHLENLDTRADD